MGPHTDKIVQLSENNWRAQTRATTYTRQIDSVGPVNLTLQKAGSPPYPRLVCSLPSNEQKGHFCDAIWFHQTATTQF